MAIILPSGFNITNVDPIDSRLTVANQAARLAFSAANVYEGLVVYQVDTNDLYVLTDAANNTLAVSWQLVGGGGSAPVVTSVTGTTTITLAAAGTNYVYLASGTFTINLPTAVNNTSIYTIKNTGTGTISIDGNGSQTIDGSLTATLPVQYTSLTLVSNNANWSII